MKKFWLVSFITSYVIVAVCGFVMIKDVISNANYPDY